MSHVMHVIFAGRIEYGSFRDKGLAEAYADALRKIRGLKCEVEARGPDGKPISEPNGVESCRLSN